MPLLSYPYWHDDNNMFMDYEIRTLLHEIHILKVKETNFTVVLI